MAVVRVMLVVLLSASLALPLSACGKKGPLDPPGKEETTKKKPF